MGGHGWALLYAPPAFVCKGALEAGGGGRRFGQGVGCVGRLGSEQLAAGNFVLAGLVEVGGAEGGGRRVGVVEGVAGLDGSVAG